MPCKIIGVEGAEDWRDMFLQLAKEVQRIHNDVCLFWLHWHVERGNDVTLRRWKAAYVDYKRGITVAKELHHERHGDRPGKKAARVQWDRELEAALETLSDPGKCPVHPWPNEFGRELWRHVVERHPGVHKTVRNLVTNKLRKTLTNHPQSGGPWKRWIITLAGEGEMPTFSRMMPIPFSVENGTLKQTDDGDFRFVLRLNRIPVPGRKMAKATVLTCTLKTRGRENDFLRKILERVVEGEYPRKGSQILRDGENWFAELCYQLPPLPKAAVEPNKVGVIRPGLTRPFRLRLNGRTEALRRRGTLVRYRLRSLSAQFKGRAEAYRKQSSAGKGHGRKRATQSWRVKLCRARQDFKDSYNKQLCRDVLNRCIREHVGKIVFIQPDGVWKKTRFLETCGKLGDWDARASVWDWYQITNLLRRYCEEQGLIFVVKKHGNAIPIQGLRAAG